MSSTHQDELHDVLKERKAKFHRIIFCLKEELEYLQIVHYSSMYLSRQKEKEFNNTVVRLNTDIKLLEEDYNELLAVHKQQEIDFNRIVAWYAEKQRNCNKTVNFYAQRELKNKQAIDICQQKVQNLTDAVGKKNWRT